MWTPWKYAACGLALAQRRANAEPRAANRLPVEIREDHLLVREFVDAIEERVAHGAVAAADAGVHFAAAQQETRRDALIGWDVVAVDASPGKHHRLGLVVVVLLHVGLVGNLVFVQLG